MAAGGWEAAVNVKHQQVDDPRLPIAPDRAAIEKYAHRLVHGVIAATGSLSAGSSAAAMRELPWTGPLHCTALLEPVTLEQPRPDTWPVLGVSLPTWAVMPLGVIWHQ